MILCENINKSFGTQVVMKSFSYQFEDNGFYLLFGESGSGKTTFLNILSGFLNFEAGKININENEFYGNVDRSIIEKDIDYITQDTFFVDFLTVYDNLRMIVDDDKRIQEILIKFGLSDKSEQYPTTLSGGEKQRLAIARSILGNKKILFLDEPTASLDGGNKVMIFELLSKIKNDVLIICSSHDAEAKEYADEIIMFDKIHEICEFSSSDEMVKERHHNIVRKKNEKKKSVSFYVKQWFKSERRNRKAEILFGLFMTIAIVLCALTDTPKNKHDSNIEYLYKVNMCRFDTNDISQDMYKELCKIDGIADVVLLYGRNLPSLSIDNDSLMQAMPEYEVNGYVIPYDKDTFKLADQIKYGSYFTDINQIILTYDMADSLMPNSPEKLIGQTITKNYYGVGDVKFEIVGIMDKLNDIEKKYLDAMEMYEENTWFLNSKFAELYIYDEEFNNNGKRSYILYFDSYRDMKAFYTENYEKYNENGSLIMGLTAISELDVFIIMFQVFLPMSFLIAIFTILFYINLIKTEIAYNNKFISVFDYSGYPIGKVINCFIRLNLIHLLKICAICATVAFGITFIVNIVNQKYMFIDFQIFTYNAKILSLFVAGIIFISAIFMNVILRRLKFTSWYKNIITQRDLI